MTHSNPQEKKNSPFHEKVLSIYDSLNWLKLCLLGVSTICIAFVFVHLLVHNFELSALNMGLVILIYFISTCALRITARIWNKPFDDLYVDRSAAKINTIIFGAGTTGRIVKRVIDEDRSSEYRIISFLDDNTLLQQEKIKGIPVLSPSDLTREYLEEFNIKTIIFTISDILPSDRSNIFRNLVDMGLEVLEVPPSNTWLDGQLQLTQLKKPDLHDLICVSPVKLNERMITHGLRNRTILVTGAAGSIGSELVRQLSRFTVWRMILIDNSETSMYNMEEELKEKFPHAPIRTILADVTDQVMMNRIFKETQPEIIFHAATNKHVPLMEENPHEAIRINVGSTEVLTKLSMKHGVKKFVMISSNKAINPNNVMGASMRICEMLLQARSMTPGNRTQFVVTRFGNMLNSNGSVINKFRSQIETGRPITVTHPDIKRSFMTIQEACQLVLEACFMGLGGEIFEFDMGEPIRILELAKQMIVLAGKVPDRDVNIEFIGLRPGENLHEQLCTEKEKTLPTYNPKVKVAEVVWLEHRKVLSDIRSLLDNSPYLSKMELIGIIEDLVTDYRSSLKKYNDSTTYKDSLELEYYPD